MTSAASPTPAAGENKPAAAAVEKENEQALAGSAAAAADPPAATEPYTPRDPFPETNPPAPAPAGAAAPTAVPPPAAAAPAEPPPPEPEPEPETPRPEPPPPPAPDPVYTGVEIFECGCSLPPEYSAISDILTLCHHSSTEEIAALNEQLLTLLADQPVNFSMSDFLKKTPETLRDHYIRDILHTDYNFRNKEENAALAVACLRQIALGIMALMTGYLLDLERHRPLPGVPEPDTDPDDRPQAGGY